MFLMVLSDFLNLLLSLNFACLMVMCFHGLFWWILLRFLSAAVQCVHCSQDVGRRYQHPLYPLPTVANMCVFYLVGLSGVSYVYFIIFVSSLYTCKDLLLSCQLFLLLILRRKLSSYIHFVTALDFLFVSSVAPASLYLILYMFFFLSHSSVFPCNLFSFLKTLPWFFSSYYINYFYW